jgi:hypothetical protein
MTYRTLPIILVFWVMVSCASIRPADNNEIFNPGIYEMDVKGTVFETLYHQRFIDHYYQDGSYLGQHFRKGKLELEVKGTYNITNGRLERVYEKSRSDYIEGISALSKWEQDEDKESNEIRNIATDSFELYILAIRKYYWQKFIRISKEEFEKLRN